MGQDNITPQQIFKVLKDFPEETLNDVWDYVEFIRFKKKKHSSPRIVKLGGILADFNIDITEGDIAKAREEMWGSLGEIRE